MGRAIVREPQAFLMDEPLSNLDAKLRVAMRASLAQLHAKLGVTTIYVTHDQTEAMTLGQRVAVMRDGHIVQFDEPQALYRRPQDVFVAAFIGSPSMNLVEATVEGGSVRFGQFTVPLDPVNRPATEVGRVVLGIRPEAFEDGATASPALPRLSVQVDVLEELGPETHVCFPVDAKRVTVETGDDGDEDDATLLASHSTLFTARVDARTGARQGTTDEPRRRPGALPLLRPRQRPEPGRRTGGGDGFRHRLSGLDQEQEIATMARSPVERKSMSETSQPATKQGEVRNRVLDLIEQLGVGDAIPSERQLTTELGVSRLTVRAALDELVREGLLVRRHGSGTFVSEPKIAQELTMTSFTEDMRRRGMVPGSRTLDIHVTPAGAHLGRLLHVSPSEPVVIISRLRLADHETMAIETLHVRESLVPGISAADLEQQSFYELLEGRYRVSIVGGLQTIEPTVTNEEESAALGVPLHSPAFVFERTTRSESGEIVEYVRSIYRGDRYRLVTELNRRALGRPGNGRS